MANSTGYKYKPEQHYAIVGNLRELWRSQFPTASLNLTDEEVYDAYMEGYFCNESDFKDEFPELDNRKDAVTLTMLQEARNAKSI